MKVNIIKENNKYYLEIERPHYDTNSGYSPSKETQKVYTLIKRNIDINSIKNVNKELNQLKQDFENYRY